MRNMDNVRALYVLLLFAAFLIPLILFFCVCVYCGLATKRRKMNDNRILYAIGREEYFQYKTSDPITPSLSLNVNVDSTCLGHNNKGRQDSNKQQRQSSKKFSFSSQPPTTSQPRVKSHCHCFRHGYGQGHSVNCKATRTKMNLDSHNISHTSYHVESSPSTSGCSKKESTNARKITQYQYHEEKGEEKGQSQKPSQPTSSKILADCPPV